VRVLLDECVPRGLRDALPGHDVRTVAEAGWAGVKNGELLKLAATRLTHVHFLIVGPSNVDHHALQALPNVHFLGRRDRCVVPSILSRCSASLVPFKKTRLTERIVPLKIFEALAAGILPVCTDFSKDLDVLERDGHVAVGRSPDAFVAALEHAILSDDRSTRERLTSFGRQQTWKARWAEMRTALADCLAASRPRQSP